jgi:hypothetical protein
VYEEGTKKDTIRTREIKYSINEEYFYIYECYKDGVLATVELEDKEQQEKIATFIKKIRARRQERIQRLVLRFVDILESKALLSPTKMLKAKTECYDKLEALNSQ